MTPEEERAAVVAWIASKAAEYERTAASVKDMLTTEERMRVITTGIAFRFIQHAIQRGAHLSCGEPG